MRYELNLEEAFVGGSEFELLVDESLETEDLLNVHDTEEELEEEFRVSHLPKKVREAYKLGALGWMLAVQRAIEAGITNLDLLSDMAFFMHHPERVHGGKGKALDPGEPHFNALVKEWKAFRTLIIPILKYLPKIKISKPAPREPAKPIPAYKDPKARKKLDVLLPKAIGVLGGRKRSRDETRLLCMLRKMKRPDAKDEFLTKEHAYKWWRENHKKIYYSIDKSTNRLRNQLLSDAKWSNTVNQFIKKAVANIAAIDSGIDEIYRIYSITADEPGNKAVLLRAWFVERFKDSRSIYSCYPRR